MRVRDGRCGWCDGGRRRAALKLALLMLPALFWSAVFASLAGALEIGECGLRVKEVSCVGFRVKR